MTNSIYNLLGFPTNDPVLSSAKTTLTTQAQTQMNLMPNLVNTWQQEDMATNNTNGYFTNPASSCIQVALTASNTVMQYTGVTCTTGAITNLVASAFNSSNTIVSTTAGQFLYHTNRMSNVVDIGDDVTNPHYQVSIGYGKILMLIVNKTDGIQDNSPMIGSFGSILAANVISANANTFLSYANLYKNTITATSVTDPDTGYITTSYSSNISLANAQALSDSANAVNSMMTTYRNQDITFFQNSKTVMDRYNAISGFGKMGQTENDLVMNHIGTDKLKTRLNS